MDKNGFVPQQLTAGEYRQRAEECARKAVLTKDAQIRTMMIGLAISGHSLLSRWSDCVLANVRATDSADPRGEAPSAD